MPFVIGVAGGSGSGKSTLCVKVADRLAGACLHITHDAYYHSLPPHLRHDPRGYNFDHPDALDTDRLVRDLGVLRSGAPAVLPEYNLAHSHRLVDGPPVAPRPVLLVEGILLFVSPRVVSLCDLTIFVDTPADLRLVRRLRRDVVHRGRDALGVLDQYERTVRPMHERFVEPSRACARLVLDGTASIDDLVGRVVREIPPFA